MAQGVGDLLLFEPPGHRAVRVAGFWGARFDEQVNRAGTFSCFLEARQASILGLDDPKAKWLRYESRAGTWGGFVTSDPWSGGVLELSAASWMALSRKRRTPRHLRTLTAPPAAIFRLVLADVSGEAPLYAAAIDTDDVGDPVTFEFRDDDFHDDVIPRLLSAGTHEIEVRHDRTWRFVVRIGSDKSHNVHLMEGRHLSDARYVGDVWAIENDLLVDGGMGGSNAETWYVVEDAASIGTYGRRQGSRSYRGTTDRGTVASQARADLLRSTYAMSAVEATVLDVDGAWRRFGLGDTVLLTLPSANRVVRARIMARAVDADAGTQRISCDVVGVV